MKLPDNSICDWIGANLYKILILIPVILHNLWEVIYIIMLE